MDCLVISSWTWRRFDTRTLINDRRYFLENILLLSTTALLTNAFNCKTVWKMDKAGGITYGTLSRPQQSDTNYFIRFFKTQDAKWWYRQAYYFLNIYVVHIAKFLVCAGLVQQRISRRRTLGQSLVLNLFISHSLV